jgi:hypothetical protein
MMPHRVPLFSNAATPLFVLVDKTLVRLNAADRSAWSDEDRMNFQALIASLKEWIDAFQANPAGTLSNLA